MCWQITLAKNDPTPPQIPLADLSKPFLDHQDTCYRLAQDLDFEFINAILHEKEVPEYNGFMTRKCRERGTNIQPRSKVEYLPMINQKASDPSTVLSAMLRAEKLADAQGQDYVVFTGDLQIYRVATQITWDDPERFSRFFLRLGGMHLLMSFVGCLGNLLEDSGFEDVIAEAFTSSKQIMAGKKFPECIRAFRMVAEEVLWPLFELPVHDRPQSLSGMLDSLDALSRSSRTTKLWTDVLIKGVLIIMRYVRAEREAEITLHMKCVEEMEKYCFAAGHINYARYAFYYRRSLESMPDDLFKHFLNGEHTMHHMDGIFNGEWSDMAIETTAMKDKASDDTILGDTNAEDTTDIYVYSVHNCLAIDRDLENIRSGNQSKVQNVHRDESKSVIAADSKLRETIKQKLALSIDPLDPTQHPDGLVNIVTGEVIYSDKVNVDNCLTIGEDQRQEFDNSWPESFQKPISKKVITMASNRRGVDVDGVKVVDTGIFYARAMALHASGRSEFDLASMLSTELAPVATSMFEDNGNFRSTSKADLKNSLKVEVPARNVTQDIGAYFLDGCAVLWTVDWPSKSRATVKDFIDAFRHHISEKYLKHADVYLVFDRYLPGSVKEMTRCKRQKGASRVFSLKTSSRLPQQIIMLNVTTNKAQLISLIVADLRENPLVSSHRLVVTGPDPEPFECINGDIHQRSDMVNTQEEADTILVCQVHSEQDARTFVVVADDTDIFLLLLHFVYSRDITCKVYMLSPSRGRHAVDINSTVQQHQTIISDVLAAHALTGCDTVASYFGIGKGKTLNALQRFSFNLSLVGDASLELNEYESMIKQASDFILGCYNLSQAKDLTAARQLAWRAKISKAISDAPKLCTLPPTKEAFYQNALRAHWQVAIWKAAIDPQAVLLDPEQHGWMKTGTVLTAVVVAPGVFLTPPALLTVIKCACGKPGSSTENNPCRYRSCKCHSSGLSCSIFCVCLGGENCRNTYTIHI